MTSTKLLLAGISGGAVLILAIELVLFSPNEIQSDEVPQPTVISIEE